MANVSCLFYTLLCYFVNCDYPFRNPNLPADVRVNDLVSRLSVDEVIQQLAKGGANGAGPAPAIPRLGIKPYQWNTECLRGDPQAGNATAFPQALALASSWNTTLLYEIAEATSVEVRGKHNYFQQQGKYGDHTGLSCFSPVINIMRDPLWGRNQETYGEDPYLTGVLGQTYVKGLHGSHPRYLRASSGCKHFDVHGGPEKNRFSFNAVVNDRDWALTFQPAFRMCVDAGATSVMCSYNAINGVPSCINKRLLTDVLRQQWGFRGYVVSDEEAIENILYFHRYLNDSVEVAARCLEAGTNLELSVGIPFAPLTYLDLKKAVSRGRISSNLLYERVKPLFLTRLRLGEFDPETLNPYNSLNLSQVLTKKHQNLAKNAASQSFVLLKNIDNFLPLRSRFQNLAIVGPMANNSEQLFGDYSPEPDPRFIVTPLQGLRRIGSRVTFAAGCQDGTPCNHYDANSISDAVRNSTLIIACLGTGQILEKETLDRDNIQLPGHQGQLLTDIMKSTSPVILLLFSSGPLDIEQYASDKIKAVFQCGFPAQAAGSALYDTLTLKNPQCNPAARLPYTWYKSTNPIPDIRNYTMHQRTYRYLEDEPQFPFGYGLSYTSFYYSDLKLSQSSLKIGVDLKLQVKVRNTGPLDGDEVIQVYLKWLHYEALRMPKLQLVGFRRVHIRTRMEQEVQFTVRASQMAVWDSGRFHQVPGHMMIFVGGQQPGQTVKVSSNVLQAPFSITDDDNGELEEL